MNRLTVLHLDFTKCFQFITSTDSSSLLTSIHTSRLCDIRLICEKPIFSRDMTRILSRLPHLTSLEVSSPDLCKIDSMKLILNNQSLIRVVINEFWNKIWNKDVGCDQIIPNHTLARLLIQSAANDRIQSLLNGRSPEATLLIPLPKQSRFSIDLLSIFERIYGWLIHLIYLIWIRYERYLVSARLKQIESSHRE